MAILQKPETLSLLGNMKQFIISSGSDVSFQLYDDEELIVEEKYTPNKQGRVTIDIKQLVQSRLSFTLSSDSIYIQPNIAKIFRAEVDGSSITFKVLRGGIANLADTSSNWLAANFLTWQPTMKAVTYHSPEWLTYYATKACELKLKAHFDDGTDQTVIIGSLSADQAYTANLQYSFIAGLLGHKYPTHYEVWVEATGERLTYIQGYHYSQPKSEFEQWFLFENSLGGIDTIRASGDTDFDAQHEHKISIIDGVSTEFAVDTIRNYIQNTGSLDEYERKWLSDFFPSVKKYLFHSSALRPIVLTESDVKYSTADLPSSFSFSFRFADANNALLNLIRNQDAIPADITLPNLDSPNFIIPPRLSEYPRLPLSEGVIIPAHQPNSEKTGVTTVGALIQTAITEMLNVIEGGGAGGQLVDVLKSTDIRSASDFNVFSSLRTLDEISKALDGLDLSDKFLSKLTADSAAGLIKFLGGAEFGEFFPGMFAGKGGRIDELGNAELTSLILRAWLEVPELRFNRQTIINEMTISDAGIIDTVTQIDASNYNLEMKLEEGEGIAFQKDDLVKGVFHHGHGFFTSFFRVLDVGLTSMNIILAADSDIPTQQNFPPKQFMNIARVGNATNPERQQFITISAKSGGIQSYAGASTFLNATLVGSMDSAQDFKHLYGDLPLKPGLLYMYAAGLVVQDIIRVDYQGVPVREIYDRGPWEAGRTYYNNDIQGTDDVWHLGCRWRCFSSSTTQEPSYVSQSWIMIEGSSKTSMEFYSSNGLSFYAGQVDTTFTPIAFIGDVDVSDEIQDWSWTRESGNSVSDDAWNAQHKNMRLLPVKNEDMTSNWTKLNPIKFICTAVHPGVQHIQNFIKMNR